MSGGGSGGGSSTTVQKADPWAGVQPYLAQGYQQLSSLYQPGQGPQYYPGQTLATPNINEVQGIDAQMAATGQMKQAADAALQSNLAMGQNAQNTYGAGSAATQAGLGGMGGLAGQTAGGAQIGANAANGLGDYGFANIQNGANGVTSAAAQLSQAGDPMNNPYFQST